MVDILVVSVFSGFNDLNEAERVVWKVRDGSGLLAKDRRTHTKNLKYMYEAT
jgi:hypothetical protein